MEGDPSLQDDKHHLCEMTSGEEGRQQATDAVHYYLRLLQNFIALT
jgi:hypothetical protein